MADGGDAGLQAGRDGRGPQRALLLRVRPSRPRARGLALPRAGGGRAVPRRRRPPRLPALRQLDRRGPRRQPVRDRGGDRGDAARAPRPRAPAAAEGHRAAPRPSEHLRAAGRGRGARPEPAGGRRRSSRRRRGGPRSATAGSPTGRSCCTSTGSWGPRWRRAAGRGAPTTASAPAPTAGARAAGGPAPPAAQPRRARRARGWPPAAWRTWCARWRSSASTWRASTSGSTPRATPTRSRRCSAGTAWRPRTARRARTSARAC